MREVEPSQEDSKIISDPFGRFAGTDEAQNVFQPQAKKAFAFGFRADAVPLGSEMTAPCKADDVGNRHDGEEFLQLCWITHVGRLQIKSIFLQVSKETLNPPAHPVKLQGLFAGESITGHQQVCSPTTRLHRLAGKEELKAEDLFTPHYFSPRFAGVVNRVPPPDIGIFLEPNHVADVLLVQVG